LYWNPEQGHKKLGCRRGTLGIQAYHIETLSETHQNIGCYHWQQTDTKLPLSDYSKPGLWQTFYARTFVHGKILGFTRYKSVYLIWFILAPTPEFPAGTGLSTDQQLALCSVQPKVSETLRV